jgi:hypothetical protein
MSHRRPRRRRLIRRTLVLPAEQVRALNWQVATEGLAPAAFEIKQMTPGWPQERRAQASISVSLGKAQYLRVSGTAAQPKRSMGGVLSAQGGAPETHMWCGPQQVAMSRGRGPRPAG